MRAALLALMAAVLVAHVARAAEPAAAPPEAAPDTTIESDIFDHYFTGRELFEKGLLDQALLEYENIREIAPEYVDVYALIGKAEVARKNWLRAAYFLLIAQKLDPKNAEAAALLEKVRATGALVAVGEVDFTWKFDAPPELRSLCFDLYGNARYDGAVLELNGLARIDKPGTYKLPIDFTAINSLRFLKKFDGKTLNEDLNQLKFKIVEEREFEMSAKEAPDAYLKLVDEYLSVGRTFRAVMALEEVVYNHPEMAGRIDGALVARLADEVRAYLRTDPKNARGHYFLAFLKFLRNEWTDCMSAFFVADGLGLDLKYRTRAVRFVDLARGKAREHEEAKAKFEAERVIEASVKEGEVLERPPDVVEKPATELSEEERRYICVVNLSQIRQAVDRFNQDNIVEMDESNFHFRPLVSGGYLKAIPKCPDGGQYDLLPGPVPTCSEHGK